MRSGLHYVKENTYGVNPTGRGPIKLEVEAQRRITESFTAPIVSVASCSIVVPGTMGKSVRIEGRSTAGMEAALAEIVRQLRAKSGRAPWSGSAPGAGPLTVGDLGRAARRLYDELPDQPDAGLAAVWDAVR